MRTMITTPDGHKARLNVSMHDKGTTVDDTAGTVSVSKRSDNQGDVKLIDVAITALDDLMVNISHLKPKTDDGDAW